MLKKIGNWLIDKWLAGFITTTFYFLIKTYTDLPQSQKENFLHFDWLNAILITPIPLWNVILIASFLLIMNNIARYSREKRKKKGTWTTEPPEEIQTIKNIYREDTFGIDSTRWAWNYEWDSYSNKLMITDLNPLCKVCGASLDMQGDYMASCSKCRLEGRQSMQTVSQLSHDVEKEIIRRAPAKLSIIK